MGTQKDLITRKPLWQDPLCVRVISDGDRSSLERPNCSTMPSGQKQEFLSDNISAPELATIRYCCVCHRAPGLNNETRFDSETKACVSGKLNARASILEGGKGEGQKMICAVID